MPVTKDNAHYLWHRLTTEDTSAEEVVAQWNGAKGDNLTPEEAKAFVSQAKKRREQGEQITQIFQNPAPAPALEVVSAKKPAKKAVKKAAKKVTRKG